MVELPQDDNKYDMIVDSYCLQGIVTDADREKLFAAVRARLQPNGYYLVSTAYFVDSRCHADETVRDDATGRSYCRYDETSLFDPSTEIVYVPIEDDRTQWEDAICIEGMQYLPNRRHRRPESLDAELTDAGFDVLYQNMGDLVCVHKDAGLEEICI